MRIYYYIEKFDEKKYRICVYLHTWLVYFLGMSQGKLSRNMRLLNNHVNRHKAQREEERGNFCAWKIVQVSSRGLNVIERLLHFLFIFFSNTCIERERHCWLLIGGRNMDIDLELFDHFASLLWSAFMVWLVVVLFGSCYRGLSSV